MSTIEVRITGGFVPGTAALAAVWVDNHDGGGLHQVSIGTAGTDGKSYGWNWDSDTANYIGFSQNTAAGASSQVDNVSISAPDPRAIYAGAVGMGLVGLLGLRLAEAEVTKTPFPLWERARRVRSP